MLWNIIRGERVRYYVGSACFHVAILWGPVNHFLVLPLQNIALPQPDHRIGITKCLPKPFSLGRLIFPKFRKPKFRTPIFLGLLNFGNPR